MNKAEKEALVLDKLMALGKLDMTEIINYLSVSESTVRRIFKRIEKSGIALRTCGGLVLIADPTPAYSFESLARTNLTQKTTVGRRAAMEVGDGDILYIDGGTTALSMCVELARLLRAGKLQDVKIFTNSLAGLDTLSPVASVGLIGGKYRKNRKDFAGYLSEMVLKELHFTKCFLGADGITVPHSFTATDFETATLNQIVALNSDEVYILCDSTKFGKVSLVSFAEASAVDVVITDSEAGASFADAFRDVGVRVIVSGGESCPE